MELKFSKIIDRLEAVLAKFADDNTESVSTEEKEQTFVEAPLADGTIISYEGDLAPGTAVFVVTEEGESVPAPEGTHALGGELEGVSIVVDADGIITEVVDERATEEPAETEEEMSSEVTEEVKEEFNVEAFVAEKISEAMEALPLNKIAEGFEAIVKENESLKAELAELKEAFNAFKELPTAEEEKEQKFSRVESAADARERRLKNRFKK